MHGLEDARVRPRVLVTEPSVIVLKILVVLILHPAIVAVEP